jgi:glycosyltransferase involved in cell wall biosynthesis
VRNQERQINILFLADEWDAYRRRRRQLASSLVATPYVKNVVYMEVPLPLSSLVNSHLLQRSSPRTKARWTEVLRARGMPRGEDSVTVFTPFVGLPQSLSLRLGSLAASFDQWLLKRQLSIVQRHLTEELPTVLVVSTPWFSPDLAETIGPDAVWYDLSEDYEGYLDFFFPTLMELKVRHNRWLESADWITAVAAPLAEKLEASYRSVYHLPNGVEAKRFAAPRPCPSDMAELPAPIIGFVGFLTGRSDIPLLLDIARLFSSGSVVLIGQENTRLSAHFRGVRNVHFLGPRPYELLPAYMQHFSVAVIPYKQAWLNNSGDPLKLYQYLAAGCPVVTYDFDWARRLADLLYIARDRSEFVSLVGEALCEPRPRSHEVLVSFLNDSDWDKRAQEALEIINRHLPGPATGKQPSKGSYVSR